MTEHRELVARVRAAMTAVAPHDLSVDELRAIVSFMEAAVGRQHLRELQEQDSDSGDTLPPDVIRLDGRRDRRAIGPLS